MNGKPDNTSINQNIRDILKVETSENPELKRPFTVMGDTFKTCLL